jgi:hypothetical protein
LERQELFLRIAWLVKFILRTSPFGIGMQHNYILNALVLTCWSRSEIDLQWLINAVDLSNRQNNSWLEFSDYDTGEPLIATPLPSFSQRRIRVTFRPKDVGEFNYDLQLENLNDSGNTVQVLVHAVVTAAHREESLVVSCGNIIDFGDCISGTWHKQRITLRNVSDTNIDIAFDAESSPVVFQLKNEDHLKRGSRGHNRVDRVNELTGDAFADVSTIESSLSASDLPTPHSAWNSRSSSPSNSSRRKGENSLDKGPLELMEFMRGSFGSPTNASDADAIEESELQPLNDLSEGLTRIEEIAVSPGMERVIDVCYRPERDAQTPDHRGGRLTKRNFRLILSYGKQTAGVKKRKVIQCKARTCTSFIEVSPKLVNFGDTDVGTLKSAPIHITNCSDLPARVEMRYISKVLNCYRGEIVIPPRQSFEIKIDIYPRKVVSILIFYILDASCRIKVICIES